MKKKSTLKKRIIVLGSTGSIGKSGLDIIGRNSERFSAAGLACHSNFGKMLDQAGSHRPEAVALAGYAAPPPEFSEAIKNLPFPHPALYFGEEGLKEMILSTKADIVLNGISGSGGLLPSLWSIESRKTLALANKETIVMGGEILLGLAASCKVKILPVDSEHSAIFHLTNNIGTRNIEEIILTASGGAFRDTPLGELQNKGLKEALNHPTWDMGQKITINSATMANKGLEVMEAMYFFGIPLNKIRVVIHPQSYVHSLVRTKDHSLYAQISLPDMRIPILNALSHPEIISSPSGRLELAGKNLEFFDWDRERYPLLRLAYEAAELKGPYPTAYNAANETAVDAFLKEKIPFLSINKVVEKTLEKTEQNHINSITDIKNADAHARIIASEIIRSIACCQD